MLLFPDDREAIANLMEWEKSHPNENIRQEIRERIQSNL